MLDQFTVYVDELAQASLVDPWIAFPAYVLAGLAGSLFPCVYPLIPVTAGFLQNRAQPGEARWKHPLLYWFGTILAYSALGAIAAASGGAFNTLMQSGLVIAGIGFLFLFLCFVTIDWYPLFWNAGDRFVQRTGQKSGVGFTMLMGAGAGFVASACVAPALVTMLIFIARLAAAGELSYGGGIAYGAFLSTGFGAGIGVPFFAAGVLGARLAKPGRWMSFVKYAFALIIFVAALYQLHKGFTVLGYSDMDIYAILGAIILLFVAVLLGLRPPQAGDRRGQVRFYFALLAAVFAAALAVRGAGFGGAASGDGISAEAADDSHEMVGNLKFYRSPEYARQLAESEGRPVFIDFYADWCTNCKEFSKLAQSNEELNAALQRAVLLKIYDTDPVFEDYMNDPRFPELQIGLPFFVVLDPSGEMIWKGVNYKDVDGMTAAIDAGFEAGEVAAR